MRGTGRSRGGGRVLHGYRRAQQAGQLVRLVGLERHRPVDGLRVVEPVHRQYPLSTMERDHADPRPAPGGERVTEPHTGQAQQVDPHEKYRNQT